MSSEEVLQNELPVSQALVNNTPDHSMTSDIFPYLDKADVDFKTFANLNSKLRLRLEDLDKEIPVWSDLREIPILESFRKGSQSHGDPRQIMQDLGDFWQNIPHLDSLGKSIPGLSCDLGKDVLCRGYSSNKETSEKTVRSDIPTQASNALQQYIPDDFDSGLGAIANDIPGLGNLQGYFMSLDSANTENEVLTSLKRKPDKRKISSVEGCEKNISDVNSRSRDMPELNELIRNIPGMDNLNIKQITNRMAEVGDAVESLTGISPTDLVSQIPGAGLMGFGESEEGDGSSSSDNNDFESVFSDLRSIGGDVAEIITDSKQFFTQLGALVGVFGTLINTGSNVIDDYSNGKVAASIFNIVLLVSVQIPTITAMLFVFLKDQIHLSWKGIMKVKEDLKELMEDLDSIMGSDDEEENDSDFDEPDDSQFRETKTDDDKPFKTSVEDDTLPEKNIHHDCMKQEETFKGDNDLAEVQMLPKTDIHLKTLEGEASLSIFEKPSEFLSIPKKDNNKNPFINEQVGSPVGGLKRKSDDSANAQTDTADAYKCTKQKKKCKKKRSGKQDEKKIVNQENKPKGDDKNNKIVLGESEATKISASSEKKPVMDESYLTSLVGSDRFRPVVSQEGSKARPVFHNSEHKPLFLINESDGFKVTIPRVNSSSRPFFSNIGFELKGTNTSANSKSTVYGDEFKSAVSIDALKPEVTSEGFIFKSFTSNNGFKTVSSNEEIKPLIFLDEMKSAVPDDRSKSQTAGSPPDDGFQTVVRKRRKKMESQKHFSQGPIKTDSNSSQKLKKYDQRNKIQHESRHGCFHHVTKPYSLHDALIPQNCRLCETNELSSMSVNSNIDSTVLSGKLTDGKDVRSKQFDFEQKRSQRKVVPAEECEDKFQQKPVHEKSTKMVGSTVFHELHYGRNVRHRDMDSKD